MSRNATLDAAHSIEEEIHAAIAAELVANSDQIEAAGLISELEAVHRSGTDTKYASYIEATLWYAKDGPDVHDIFYIPIVENGKLINDVAMATSRFKEELSESLAKDRW